MRDCYLRDIDISSLWRPCELLVCFCFDDILIFSFKLYFFLNFDFGLVGFSCFCVSGFSCFCMSGFSCFSFSSTFCHWFVIYIKVEKRLKGLKIESV